MSRRRGLLLLLAATASIADAHHSIAAYDSSRTIEVTGTLTRVQLANPHCLFHISARDGSGKHVAWIIEGAGAATVLRAVGGGSGDRFAAGQAVTVTFNPARDGRASGNLLSLRFADGRVLEGIRIP